MAAPLQRELIRGDTRQVNISVVDSHGPIDITGSTVFFTLNSNRDPANDNGAAIAKTITNLTDPTHGRTSVTLTSGETESVSPGQYYFDVQLVDTWGAVVSRRQAVLTVISDITRRTS